MADDAGDLVLPGRVDGGLVGGRIEVRVEGGEGAADGVGDEPYALAGRFAGDEGAEVARGGEDGLAVVEEEGVDDEAGGGEGDGERVVDEADGLLGVDVQAGRGVVLAARVERQARGDVDLARQDRGRVEPEAGAGAVYEIDAQKAGEQDDVYGHGPGPPCERGGCFIEPPDRAALGSSARDADARDGRAGGAARATDAAAS